MVETIKMEPVAYLRLLMHLKASRMKVAANMPTPSLDSSPAEGADEKVPELPPNAINYGYLTGFVEENIMTITNYIPFYHSMTEVDFECLHSMFAKVEETNEALFDPDYLSDQVVGWVRSCATDDVNYSSMDVRNHIYMQTAYHTDAVLLLVPAGGDQYMMEFRSFRDRLAEIDETSPFSELTWNFKEVEDIDEIFQIVVDIYKNKRTNQPIILEKTLGAGV